MTSFEKHVSDLSKSLSNKNLKVDNFKSETFIESIKDWSELYSLDEVKNWFQKKQKELSLQIEDIPLSECRGWALDQKEGNITHESGEFFYIQGVRVLSSESREVGAGGWDQPMMTQVGLNGGILGLIRCKINSIPYYLVEAKAEPGNPDGIQISPTLQATFSNLKAAHKGRKPHYSDFFEKYSDLKDTKTYENERLLFRQWMSEDGGRLHLKRNLGMLLEVDKNLIKVESDNFIWLSLMQIKELIKINSWVNPHVRGIISSL